MNQIIKRWVLISAWVFALLHVCHAASSADQTHPESSPGLEFIHASFLEFSIDPKNPTDARRLLDFALSPYYFQVFRMDDSTLRETLPIQTLLYKTEAFKLDAHISLLCYYKQSLSGVEFVLTVKSHEKDRKIQLFPYHAINPSTWNLLSWKIPESMRGNKAYLEVRAKSPINSDNWIGLGKLLTTSKNPTHFRWKQVGLTPISMSLKLMIYGGILLLSGTALALQVFSYFKNRLYEFFPLALVLSLLVHYLLFFCHLLHPLFGYFSSILVSFISLLLITISGKKWKTLTGSKSDFSKSCALWLLVSLLSLHAGYLLGGSLTPSETSATRYRSPSLPADNNLPYAFANRILTQESIRPFFEDWTASDRPPLQTAVTLSLQPFMFSAEADYHLVGLLLQCSLIPMLYSMLRKFGVSSKVAFIIPFSLAFTGSFLINSFFVWPKLLGAGLLCWITAQLFYKSNPNEPQSSQQNLGSQSFMIATAAVLSMLSHGSSLIALIPIFSIFWILDFRKNTRVIWQTALIFGLFYLPWFLFQKIGDPPGDRLLKWHLAGYPHLTNQSFFNVLVAQYKSLDFPTWLSYKWQNIQTLWGDWRMAFAYLYPHQVLFDYKLIRNAVFLYFSLALFPFLPAILFLPFLLYKKKSIRREENERYGWIFTTTFRFHGVILSGLLIWTVMIYLPKHTILHQGSYYFLFITLLMLLLMLIQTSKRLFVAALLVNLIYILTAWILPPFQSNYQNQWLIQNPGINVGHLFWIVMVIVCYAWNTIQLLNSRTSEELSQKLTESVIK